ncbi:hypothetical protein BYT27DRAFT_7263438 [Phlegmacium glaucopus]|nr:hypothetical protein BYT27DRAFT_7263438 [Phlegmacium glaucopus]
MSIRPFNPLLPQSGSQKDIQEVIYYAESRFWYILNEISTTPIDHQRWTQKLLHRELLFILSYVGIAVSVGQTIDIPIILRSLANSMALLNENALPLPFDPHFLATLDIGTHEKGHKSQVVSAYEHCWWSGRKPRDLDTIKILDASTLETCIEHYQIQQSHATHAGAGAEIHANAGPTPTPGNTPNLHAGSNPACPGAGPTLSASTHSHPAGPGDSRLCPQCNKYCDLLSEVLQDILKVYNLSSGMSTSSETQWKLGIRRASTFHLLHEAALLKETAGIAHQY